jgi:NAD(P)H-dependent FMN reductase
MELPRTSNCSQLHQSKPKPKMSKKHRVLAISGSTRQFSTNLNLINAFRNLTTDIFDITIFEGLTQLPHFNPDLDQEHPPQEIIDFRQTLRAHDGVLICTPEYAMGVPGTLKNALDWTVSSMEFSHKPVALITASSQGQKGHAALLETLYVIEAKMTPATQLLISFVKTKVSTEGTITDAQTLADVQALILSFATLLAESVAQG